jgi:hypothetical protein
MLLVAAAVQSCEDHNRIRGSQLREQAWWHVNADVGVVRHQEVGKRMLIECHILDLRESLQVQPVFRKIRQREADGRELHQPELLYLR